MVFQFYWGTHWRIFFFPTMEAISCEHEGRYMPAPVIQMLWTLHSASAANVFPVLCTGRRAPTWRSLVTHQQQTQRSVHCYEQVACVLWEEGTSTPRCQGSHGVSGELGGISDPFPSTSSVRPLLSKQCSPWEGCNKTPVPGTGNEPCRGAKR